MSTAITTALALCKKAHRGQTRRDGVTPYHTHPIAVAELLEGPIAKVTALLHDVLEDTTMSVDTISSELYLTDLLVDEVDAIMEALSLLTHPKMQPYMGYIAGLSKNQLAVTVKLADMQHNVSTTPTLKQLRKYAAAVDYLLPTQP